MSSSDRRQIKGLGITPDESNRPETQLQAFLDSIPAIAWCSLPHGGAAFWNKRWHDFTGLSPRSSRNSEWQSAIHPEDLDQFLQKWSVDLDAGHAGEVEVRLRRMDGIYRRFLMRYEPSRDKSGQVVNWFGAAVDFEDRSREEQKLRESELQFRTITDLIRQYIVVLAPDGTVLYVNQVALAQTGIQLRDVQKDDAFWVPFHPDDIERVRSERHLGLSGGIPFELEVRVRMTDGKYRWHLVQYNPQKDEGEQVIRWYATGTDIDIRKKAEESLRNENVTLREEIDRPAPFEDIVGSSKPMRRVLQQVAKVSPSDATVLILGETGTGKEMIARAVHRRSKREGRVFVRVNCAAILESLIASELFGHEKGAFTGALQRRIGRFEAANGGTLFLDEVGDLPSETQIALLRVLQERELERVGSNHPISVDVRLIAATNRNLQSAIANGTFRQDLFFRLNVFPIAIPPLRERPEDIPVLVEYFIERYAQKAAKRIRHIGKQTLALMKAYRWPGNIRELQNVVERGVILSDTDTLAVDESWLRNEGDQENPRKELSALVNREIEMIEAALAECHGRISGPSGAAAKLGLPRQTLESKIRKFELNRHGRKT